MLIKTIFNKSQVYESHFFEEKQFHVKKRKREKKGKLP